METKIRFVTPVKWILHRRRLLAFAAAFGDGAIGEDALRRLAELDPVLLGRPDRTGTACVVAKAGGWTAGVALAIGRGREAFVVVVHPAVRGRGIGTTLTRALLARTGSLDCRVPASDSRAVAMCRRAGLAEVDAPEDADGGFVRFAGALTAGPDRCAERECEP
ncbi:Putative Acetyltransferase (GNAT) family protein [Thermobacillus xylanilyticus]|jgi:GNAT superfamily N-acetyltransferase|uniref:Acetyltransferase (GNAT) family protein n=2 Tax=Thermobacillus TaxID=76632 RepID=L0EG05_THECK|nr:MULTISPECIES: GNAT family N-acetyltransferase [Thermobacillus]AGA58727.1 acetyltransferase (GNAT) family protein [Thermobacillus composti KWC4]REJ14583.1 MAG: N-acetyltransferase [Paenibacillaceae bacterium]CAG5091919.1 Putative Acetyltransferase (GNAT) family protein [Thermobacillus xylanilyticus]